MENIPADPYERKLAEIVEEQRRLHEEALTKGQAFSMSVMSILPMFGFLYLARKGKGKNRNVRAMARGLIPVSVLITIIGLSIAVYFGITFYQGQMGPKVQLAESSLLSDENFPERAGSFEDERKKEVKTESKMSGSSAISSRAETSKDTSRSGNASSSMSSKVDEERVVVSTNSMVAETEQITADPEFLYDDSTDTLRIKIDGNDYTNIPSADELQSKGWELSTSSIDPVDTSRRLSILRNAAGSIIYAYSDNSTDRPVYMELSLMEDTTFAGLRIDSDEISVDEKFRHALSQDRSGFVENTGTGKIIYSFGEKKITVILVDHHLTAVAVGY